MRSSGRDLLSLVDTDDPAFAHIAAALCQARASGVELDAEAVMEAVRLGRERMDAGPSRPEPEVPPLTQYKSIVYYVRRQDLIKIGVTRGPRNRFASLLPDEIMAFEPGARAREMQRHEQFAHLRMGGSEYFQRAADLDAHMQSLRVDYGDPDPTWPTLGSVSLLRATRAAVPLKPALSPDLVTASQGARLVEVRKNTVDSWVHRGRLMPAASDERGRPLYLLDHVKQLAQRSFARGVQRASSNDPAA